MNGRGSGVGDKVDVNKGGMHVCRLCARSDSVRRRRDRWTGGLVKK